VIEMNTIELDVQGMTCGSCVKHVTQALQAIPGVTQVDVDLANGRARVEGDLQAGGAALIAALAHADYPASIAVGAVAAQPAKAAGCQPAQGGKGGCCCG
jgi:copper chaperone CopZ